MRSGRIKQYHFQAEREPSVPALLKAVSEDPDRFLEDGLLFKKGSKGFSAQITVDGKKYFLKKYYKTGLLKRLVDVFRGSRARRTWQVHVAAFASGLPVPEPYFFMERRCMGFPAEGYLLMEFLEGSLDLQKIWDGETADRHSALVRKVAQVVARMHASGFVHGDLKWFNILGQSEGDDYAFYLTDLDSMKQIASGRRGVCQKDLRRFKRDLEAYSGDTGFMKLFDDAYQRVC